MSPSTLLVANKVWGNSRSQLIASSIIHTTLCGLSAKMHVAKLTKSFEIVGKLLIFKKNQFTLNIVLSFL